VGRWGRLACIGVALSTAVACWGRSEGVPAADLPRPAAGERADGNALLVEPVVLSRPWRLAFAAKDAVPVEGDGSFWGRSWRAMQAYATSRGATIRLVPTACMTCVEDQVAALRMLVADGDVDGLILGPVDSVHLAGVVEEVVAAGIPTLAYDTPVDARQVLTLVTPDNLATGRAVGAWVARRLGGKGKVVLLDGSWSHLNALERRAGMLEGLSAGGITVEASQAARWKRNLAAAEVRRWLPRLGGIDAIVAANDAMALGALDALEGNPGGLLVTGVDGDPEAVEAVRAGRLGLTVDRAAETEAAVAVEVMLRHLERGQAFPPQVVVSELRLVEQGTP
jgi:ABC-type sugar transport system substrate-binding protein